MADPAKPIPPEWLDSESLTPVDGNRNVEFTKRKKTTFREASKIDQGETPAEKSKGSSGDHPPLAHHLITELRKFLVPVIATLAGLIAGGAGGWWRGMVAKDAAVSQVRQDQQDEGVERQRIREEVQRLIRERVRSRIGGANWGEVTRTLLNPDTSPILREVVGMNVNNKLLSESQVRALVVQQIETAQCAVPPAGAGSLVVQPRSE